MCKENFAVNGKGIMPGGYWEIAVRRAYHRLCGSIGCQKKALDKTWFVDIIIFTHFGGVMPRKNANSGKRDALRRQRCLNPRPERVADPLFQQSGFFDVHDLVQVKYEMLRRVQIEQKPVSQAAAAFGFSRPSYYQAELDFQNQGLVGLIPEKPGPRKAHKLTAEVLEYVQQIRAKQPSWDMTQLATAIQEHFGIPVHPRSIERALERQEKKRR